MQAVWLSGTLWWALEAVPDKGKLKVSAWSSTLGRASAPACHASKTQATSDANSDERILS